MITYTSYTLKDQAVDVFLGRYTSELKQLADLNNIYFDESHSFTVVKRYLKYNNTPIHFYSIDLYKALLSYATKLQAFFNNDPKYQIKVFCALATHVHAYTPKIPYLALTFSCSTKDNQFLKLKLEPYIGENNIVELCQGVTAAASAEGNAFTFKRVLDTLDASLEPFKYLNLSPSTLYSFYLATKLKLGYYDTERFFYKQDLETLEKFFHTISRVYDINIQLDKGIPSKIKNVQAFSLELESKGYKLPHISSLIKPLKQP